MTGLDELIDWLREHRFVEQITSRGMLRYEAFTEVLDKARELRDKAGTE